MKIKKSLLIITIAILAICMVIFSSRYGWDIICSVPNINPDESLAKDLEKHVRVLADEIGERNTYNYEKLKASEDYITKVLESYRYTVQYQQYKVEDHTVSNIIALKTGAGENRNKIVIGAHYDTYKHTPGADDNASGVAGLLELAGLASSASFLNDIEFVAFVNEEPPFFKTDNMGSRYYTRELKKNNTIVKAAIILEMLGYYSSDLNSQNYPIPLGLLYPNKGNFLLVVGNSESKGLVNDLVGTFRKSAGLPVRKITVNVPGTDFSDHWAFWKEGYEAVMITDTAFYRNKNYHKGTDTYDKLNYTYMAEAVEGIFSALREIDKK